MSTLCRVGGLAAGLFVCVAGCRGAGAGPRVSRPAAAPLAAPATNPPTPLVAPAPGASACAPGSQHTAPRHDRTPAAAEATSLADDGTWQDCKTLRRREVAQRPRAPDKAWLSPPICGHVLGWAGIGTVYNGYAFGFSRNSRRFVDCGEGYDGCGVVDLATGNTVLRVPVTTADWGGNAASFPIEQTPPVRRLYHRLGVSSRVGSFPYARDLFVSWFIEGGGRQLYVTFVDRKTSTERIVLRFPQHELASDEPIVPEKAWLSPDGSVLAFRVGTGQGGTGIEVGLVNVHAEAAALYRQVAAESRSRTAKVLLRKAAAADRRAAKVARVLP